MAGDLLEQDEVRKEVEQQLAQTSFRCSSLSQLSGGTANFVYRGIPLSGDPESIIIKHTKNYLSSNASFKLDAERCHFEGAILKALDGLESPELSDKIKIKTPQLFHFDKETNTQVLEDLPDSVDLKHYLISEASRDMSKTSALALGNSLGSWLRAFHSWAAKPEQAEIREILSRNQPLKDLKFYINYIWLLDTIGKFPTILEDSRDVFEKVRESAAEELKRTEYDDEYNVIHGDFWTGNVLMSSMPLTSDSQTTLFVIDWEMAQIGSRALDLGQMIAETYETKLFKNVEHGVWVIEGLMDAYGHLTDRMAFRTAIQVGTHLVCFGSRVAGWGSPEQVEEVVNVGRDLIVQAWKENKSWFEGHHLRCLFQW
ncbi:hypothetical protein PMG11_10661 [Penicillium brasilianum]|uniref:Aminoglycoside phosphotransferase domain-containing protein n=1 Tax=Penicillium brasilianum TaxID=104259 RepID=A0A0F7TZU4_PENBI|nr:hypothetical protein PMG11_10661 [Penicillium brasilianum]